MASDTVINVVPLNLTTILLPEMDAMVLNELVALVERISIADAATLSELIAQVILIKDNPTLVTDLLIQAFEGDGVTPVPITYALADNAALTSLISIFDKLTVTDSGTLNTIISIIQQILVSDSATLVEVLKLFVYIFDGGTLNELLTVADILAPVLDKATLRERIRVLSNASVVAEPDMIYVVPQRPRMFISYRPRRILVQ